LAIQANIVDFLTGTGAVGTTVPVTGVGFVPQAVIFFGVGETGSANIVGRGTQRRSIGFGVSSSDNRAVANNGTDAVDPTPDTTIGGRHTDANCVVMMTTGGGTDGEAKIQTMDSDGFTLEITDQFATSFRMFAICLAGFDNVKGGRFQEPSAIGNFDVTDVGFQPDTVLVISQMGSGTPPTTQSDARFEFGASTRIGGDEGFIGVLTNRGDTNRHGKGFLGEFLKVIAEVTKTTETRAELVQMLSNGFRLNFSERLVSQRHQYYLAFKGGAWKVGRLLTRTDGSNIVVTGTGMTPKIVIFASHCRAEDPVNSVTTAHDRFSFGAATSTTNRAAIGTEDQDAQNPTITTRGMRFDAVYQRVASGANVGLMDLVSFESGGFTCVMDDVDPDAAFVLYVAVGDATSPSGNFDIALKDNGADTFDIDLAAGGTITNVFLSESQAVTDSILRTINAIRNQSDSSVVVDDIYRTLVLLRLSSESQSVTDNIHSFLSFVILLSDSFGVSDSVRQFVDFVRALSETQAVTDDVFRLLLASRLMTESIAVTDNVFTFKSFFQFASESIAVADFLARQSTLLRQTSESIAVRDQYPVSRVNLLLAYDMEALTGGLMEDLSGHGDHGTITGATESIGRFGRGRNFNGTSDQIVVPNESHFEFDNMTVGIWANPDLFTLENGFPRTLASKSQFSVNNQDWEFTFTTSGAPEFAVVDFDSVRYRATSPTALSAGEWHHIVGVRSGSTVKIFVDGIEKASIGTAPATHNNSNTPIRIGSVDSGAAGHFDGVLDEFFVFDRALSDTEISALYTYGNVAASGIFRLLTLIRQLSDSTGVTEVGLLAGLLFFRFISDSISMTDAIRPPVILFGRLLSDAIGVTDDPSRVVQATRSQSDTLSVIDAVARIVTWERTRSDSVGVSDSVSKTTAFLRQLVESQGMTDDVRRIIQVQRSLSDTQSIAEAIRAGREFWSRLSEVLSISDNVQKEHIIGIVFKLFERLTYLRRNASGEEGQG